jgi:glycogen synthase
VLERLLAAGFDHTLVVVGGRRDGDDEQVATVGGSPLEGRVAFVGEVSDAELVGLYRGADCLLHLSKGEGFGLPALEAMACATPVVAAAVDSLPEVVGDAGVLCAPDDIDGTARAIIELLRSERRRDELGAAGLARASLFTWERCAELTVAAYEQALSTAGTRTRRRRPAVRAPAGATRGSGRIDDDGDADPERPLRSDVLPERLHPAVSHQFPPRALDPGTSHGVV